MEDFLPAVALTLYSKATGDILAIYTIPEHTKPVYENDVQGFIDGHYDPSTYKINLTTLQPELKDRSVELLSDLQREKEKIIKDMFEQEISVITSKYTQSERDTFALQEAEASSWLHDANTSTPLIDSILVTIGSNNKSEYANTIIVKSNIFKALVGECIARRKLRTIQYEAVANSLIDLQSLTFT